jgi:CubicO group peptidase (beta-lactamase class C family)
VKISRMVSKLAASLFVLAAFFSLPAWAVDSSIDRLLSSHAKPGTPAISVAVIRNGRSVYRKTLGLSDIENGIPAKPNSVFEVGSVSKMFTALAVERLIVSGKLSGQDNVQKYILGFPSYSAPITVRELLQHTSGLRDYFELMAMQGIRFDDSVTQDEVVGLIERQKEINFTPGTDYNYSNSEYALLAKIVEKVTGRPFADYMGKTIFAPLGMTGAQFHASRVEPIPYKAQSYIAIGPGKVIALPFNSDEMGPSGAWMAADDLGRWLIYLDKAVAQRDAAVAAMVKPTVLANDKTLTSGEGIFHGTHDGYAELYHDGGDSGYRSIAMLFPDEHLGIAIETNSPSDDLIKLSEAIADNYLPAHKGLVGAGPDGAAGLHAAVKTKADLAGLAGTYRSEELDTSYTLRVEDGKLFADHIRNGSIALTPLGKDAWTGNQWWCQSLTVEHNTAGQVTGFRMAGFRNRRGVLFARLR